MKSLPFAAFLVLAAVACDSQSDKPGSTTTTSAEQPMPAGAMDNTTPPPAVPPEMNGPAKAKAPVTPSMSKDDGLTSTSPIPTTEDTDTDWSKKDGGASNVTPAAQTTTTTTTVKKKPVEQQGKGYGPGAARNNGINSSGPVGNGGGGVR